MSLSHTYLAFYAFGALVAWGLAVRLAPILWHFANAFFIGIFFATLTSLWLIATSSRGIKDLRKPVYQRVPRFITPTSWLDEKRLYDGSHLYEPLQLHPTSQPVSSSLGSLIDLVLRDFVSSWYRAISPTPHFVHAVDRNIRVALIELRDRVLAHDVADILVSEIIPLVTEHLKEFDHAERLVRGRATNRNLPDSEEMDLAIAAKYKDGRLHPAADLAYSDTRSPQQEHLRKMLVRILPFLLDDSMLRSRAVLVLIKEIVACAVLLPLAQMLGDPDTWNQLVEAYGTSTLQDRKNVKKMRAALDEHAGQKAKKQLPPELPRLQAHDSERAFEKFVRVIRKTKTLADARRFRNQVTSQLARERLVEGQDPVYLRRLEMGKRVLDQKIAKMTHTDVDQITGQSSEVQTTTSTKNTTWSMIDIMRTASGLSYFMEFMDRQNKMALVQFWVVVDGFRNPLEDDFGDETVAATITWTDTDRLDIAQIAENYIMKGSLAIPNEFQDAVQDFLQAGRKASPEQYRAARMAILASQSAVQEELEQKYLPKFRDSDLYYKFLASDDGRARALERNPVVSLDVSSTMKLGPARSRIVSPPLTRNSSQAPTGRSRDLRRAALSSSDIKALGANKASDRLAPIRRSLDVDRPLFDDDDDLDPLASSVLSMGNDSNNDDLQAEPEVIEHMEAAMTDIMAGDPVDTSSQTGQDALFKSHLGDTHPPRPSLETARTDSAVSQKQKPSLAALGLVNSAGRIGVFQDNDLFGDEAKFAEDDYADHEGEDRDDEIHQAAPGDLGLAEAITNLSDDIERLVSQDSVVDTLTRKAELTNNIAELRILGKSKASLQREIRRKELQRQQYIVQESDNSLYGRASIAIESVVVGREEDGQEYAVYVVKVKRQAIDQMPAASWAVAHRYSEFHDLHQRLRRRYPSTRNLDFPRRRMVMKLQKQFLQNRRIALEAYLQQLLRMPDVCRSRELRSFLSQQAIAPPDKAPGIESANTQDMVSRIYNSVTDGMDEFLGNIAVLDQISAAGQNLISAATSQIANNPQAPVAEEIFVEPGSIAEAEAELRAFEDKELAPFVKPICDIFLEVFELNRGNNWLRGRAVVVVIHQLLGGTVERKIRDSIGALFSADTLLRYLSLARDAMWPLQIPSKEANVTRLTDDSRKMRPSGPQRTAIQKEASRREAAVILGALVPELAGSVVGRSNAHAAAKRLCSVMNNRRLNEHLIYTILDKVIASLFDITSASVLMTGRESAGKDKDKGRTGKVR